MIRAVAAAAALALSIGILQRFVIREYSMNLEKGALARSTDEAFRLQTSDRAHAGRLAGDNVARLQRLAARYPSDADLQVILAANCRLIGRNADAIRAYAAAVRCQPTPEMLLSLGQLQIQAGLTAEGEANVKRAERFRPGVTQGKGR